MFHQLTTVVTNSYTHFSVSIVFAESEQAWHTLPEYLLSSLSHAGRMSKPFQHNTHLRDLKQLYACVVGGSD